MDDLDASEQRMQLSLEGSGKILENLVIRAPVDGQLSRPELDPGQNIVQGQSLGQVDVLGSYKVRVPIDELYLPRITTGLPATTTVNNKTYHLAIAYGGIQRKILCRHELRGRCATRSSQRTVPSDADLTR